MRLTPPGGAQPSRFPSKPPTRTYYPIPLALLACSDRQAKERPCSSLHFPDIRFGGDSCCSCRAKKKKFGAPPIVQFPWSSIAQTALGKLFPSRKLPPPRRDS